MSTGQESSRDPRRRRRLEWIWYGVALLYCGFRVLLADRYVRRYGLNVGAFAVVEFASTIPYAIGTAKLVEAFIDRDRHKATIWALVASGGFPRTRGVHPAHDRSCAEAAGPGDRGVVVWSGRARCPSPSAVGTPTSPLSDPKEILRSGTFPPNVFAGRGVSCEW